MSVFWIIYLSLGAWHFGKVINDILEYGPHELNGIINCLAWLVILIFAGFLWPLAMGVHYYHERHLNYLRKKGFRFI